MVAKKIKFLSIVNRQSGFTMIEMLIAFLVISIIAMIAIPSYQYYITSVTRGEMMTELQKRSSLIESRKMAEGSYSKLKGNGQNLLADLEMDYPNTGEAFYTVEISPSPMTSKWIITATPIVNKRMAQDGKLSLNFQGIKCRVLDSESKCGMGDKWKK